MKKILLLIMVAILSASLFGCAATSGGGKAKVKCPACGYEFEAPLE